MSVNFDEMRKENPTIRANGWCKSITSLDKSTPTGYSLIGEFKQKGKGEFNYSDGLYLDCSKPRGEKNYHLFKVVNGEPIVLQTLQNPQGRWATELWSIIDNELSKNPLFSKEYQAQHLANLVLENCDDKRILDEVARIISSQYTGEGFFKNSMMLKGFLNTVGVEYPMSRRKREKLDANDRLDKTKLDYLDNLDKGFKPLQSIFKVYVEEKGFSLEQILGNEVNVDFRKINEFELMENNQFNKYVWNHWWFDANTDILKFDWGDWIVLGFHKGDKWDKPCFFVRIFDDKNWDSFCGLSEE